MITRKAKQKDVPFIVSLWKAFLKDHSKVVIKHNKKLKPHLALKKNALNIFRKFLQKNIRSKNGEVYVVDADGKIVAYLLIYIKDNLPVFKLRKIGYLSDLYIKKEFRGKRISSKLKSEAIKWFRKKGVKYVSIMAYTDNKLAHSIYKKWGFFDYHVELRMKL